MKTLKLYILSALLTVMALGCYAEEYLPILENGKSWIVCICRHNMEEVYTYKQVSVSGNARIAGRDCKEIQVTEVYPVVYPEETETYWGRIDAQFMTETLYAYEENGKVYRINPIDGSLYFIFSMHEDWDEFRERYDQSLWEDLYAEPAVTTIENIGGKDRRCLWFPHFQYAGRDACVIEGIGPCYDFWPMIYPMCIYQAYSCVLIECRMNEEVIMTAEDFAALRAPGSNAVEALPAEPEGMYDRGASFDLQGRPVTNPVPGTIQVTSDNRKILTR